MDMRIPSTSWFDFYLQSFFLGTQKQKQKNNDFVCNIFYFCAVLFFGKFSKIVSFFFFAAEGFVLSSLSLSVCVSDV